MVFWTSLCYDKKINCYAGSIYLVAHILKHIDVTVPADGKCTTR